MLRPRSGLVLPLLFGLAGLIPEASAQAQTTVDEAVFRLEVEGRRIGTETFSIQRRGRGDAATTIARGRIVIDSAGIEQEMTTSLELEGPELRPSRYQISVRGPRPQEIDGRLVGRRFSARIVSPAGEMMREYLASEGAVIVDEGVAHHHYFLAQRAGGGSGRVPVIVPRQSRQVTAGLSVDGPEQTTIADRRVSARRLVVDLGGTTRHVWVDGEGRILRVAIPALGLVAQRTTAPR